MRSVQHCLKLNSSFDMTDEEREQFRNWLDREARYTTDSATYCCLLGWFVLDRHIPISPKEAGFE